MIKSIAIAPVVLSGKASTAGLAPVRSRPMTGGEAAAVSTVESDMPQA